jgi:hypothetical protein
VEPQFFETHEAFRAWLDEHHATATEVLVGFHTKSTGRASMTWTESVREAFCFGWIDGIRRSLGAESYTIRFTPRRSSSIWSSRNVRNVEELILERRMTPAGLAGLRPPDLLALPLETGQEPGSSMGPSSVDPVAAGSARIRLGHLIQPGSIGYGCGLLWIALGVPIQS